MRSRELKLRLAVAVCLLAGGVAGCAHHQIPAIDPSGEGLFAGTTTLATHDLLHGGIFHHHRDPQPAVPVATVPAAVVPVKPPCAPPIEAVPLVPTQPLVAVPLAPVPVRTIGCGPAQMPPQLALPGKPQAGGPICPGGPGADGGPELKITPARVVVPVNTEVVMAAGICCPDGYYVMRQPLEWMLAQDGAGQIVAVGHESPHNASFVLRNSPQKVATNYARAHTSTISQVLDRGTPSPADDVYLQKGQSWITVTSPTEGTSHVVVWAPKEQNWDRRMASATIYWVDAAWRFPPSVTTRAGAKQTLTTILTRSSGEPISGWTVRYEVLEGPASVFSARGNTAVEVVTDRSGRAVAELLPQSLEAGITTVRVQIIRPGTSRGDLPQMVVGQGTTSVQWTTPGLSVRALGTSSVAADGAIAYRVEVTNSGDLPTRGVTLSFTPPPGVTLLNSTPAGQTFGQRYQWQLGDLAPRTTSVVELNCRAAVTASVRSTFRAASSDGLTAEGNVPTEVRANALAVKMTGPESVEVGREAKFLVDVTNVGTAPLTNITASDTFDPGLAHAQGERSPIVRTLAAPLAPGQSDHFALTLVVTQPGRQCHRLDVTAEGGHSAAARACVTGVASVVTPAQLAVRVTGPPTRRAGEIGEYVVEVKNNGSAPATNVVLTVTWGVNLELDQATRGHEDDLARLTTRWRIAQLAGGESVTRQLNCLCLNPDDRATVRATVTSQQTPAAASAEAVTQIGPAAAASGRPAPAPARPEAAAPGGSPAVAGSLKVTAGALASPIMVGATTTCVITIANDRNVPDRDVTVRAEAVEGGLAIVRVPGSPARAIRSAADSVEFDPIREIRAGEQLAQYRIEVRGVKPGPQKLRVTVTSSLSPTGVVADAETTVIGP